MQLSGNTRMKIMKTAWACDRCSTLHTSNPDKCRSCGYNIMRPVSGEELRQRGDGVEKPESLDLDDIKKPAVDDAGGDDSPDLNPDGSLSTETSVEPEDTDTHQTDSSGVLSRLRKSMPW